jgi:hypothetical protein
MNWGNKLILVFIAFAGLMGTLIYQCMQTNFELVSKDYYTEELRYQDKIDGMNNANKISDVTITEGVEQVSIQLPKELDGKAVEGQAWFYCVTNASNDRKLPIELNDEGLFIIEKAALAKASYTVKLTWQVGEEKYHTEKFLELN